MTLAESHVKTFNCFNIVSCENKELSAKTGVGLLGVVWYQLIPNVPQLKPMSLVVPVMMLA